MTGNIEVAILDCQNLSFEADRKISLAVIAGSRGRDTFTDHHSKTDQLRSKFMRERIPGEIPKINSLVCACFSGQPAGCLKTEAQHRHQKPKT